MAGRLIFHPDALLEYAEATGFYLQEASVPIADAFTLEVESSLKTLVETPERWPRDRRRGVRRAVLKRFPYVIYYRWEPESRCVTIYAVMHASRKPGYWLNRL